MYAFWGPARDEATITRMYRIGDMPRLATRIFRARPNHNNGCKLDPIRGLQNGNIVLKGVVRPDVKIERQGTSSWTPLSNSKGRLTGLQRCGC